MYDKKLDFEDVLKAECINMDLHSSGRTDVLSELLRCLVEAGRIEDPERALSALEKRERISSTALGRGVAVPHAEDPAVEHPSLAIGISRKGVDFEALDGEPVHLFFMMLFPQGGRLERQRMVAQIIGLLRHPEARRALTQAQRPEEVREYLLRSLGNPNFRRQ